MLETTAKNEPNAAIKRLEKIDIFLTPEILKQLQETIDYLVECKTLSRQMRIEEEVDRTLLQKAIRSLPKATTLSIAARPRRLPRCGGIPGTRKVSENSERAPLGNGGRPWQGMSSTPTNLRASNCPAPLSCAWHKGCPAMIGGTISWIWMRWSEWCFEGVRKKPLPRRRVEGEIPSEKLLGERL
jgi:hypothetical protein